MAESTQRRLTYLVLFVLLLGQSIFFYSAQFFLANTPGITPAYFFVLASAISLAALYLISVFVDKIGIKPALKSSLAAATGASYFALILSEAQPYLLGVVVIAWAISIVCLDVLLESITPDNRAGRIRGHTIALVALTFMIGPYASSMFSFETLVAVFTVISLFSLIISFPLAHSIRNRYRPDIQLTRSSYIRLYRISVAIEIFFSVYLVYFLLHVKATGQLTDYQVGFVTSLFAICLFIAPFAFGALADRARGEKAILVTLLVLLALVSIGIYLVSTTNILFWLLMASLAGIFIAAVKVFTDSFFFRRVSGSDARLIFRYRTSRWLAELIAFGCASAVFLFLPTPAIFVVSSGILVLAAITAYKL